MKERKSTPTEYKRNDTVKLMPEGEHGVAADYHSNKASTGYTSFLAALTLTNNTIIHVTTLGIVCQVRA